MSALFLKVLNMGIAAGWLILAVLLLRLLLKGAPRWIPVLLWGLVAVRLVLPVMPRSAVSLIPSAETIPMGIMTDPQPGIRTGIEAVNHAVNPVFGAAMAPVAGDSVNPLQVWIPVLAAVWLVGMAALLAHMAVSSWRLRRSVRTAAHLRDNLYRCDRIASPFVFGLRAPRIYLPAGMDAGTAEHVIAHEQAHIRRKDHWWKLLGFLLLSVYWFHPLLWLAYGLLCRDIELACDASVIRGLDREGRADYTQALLACSTGRGRLPKCPLAFGEVGVKARVRSVLRYKKPALLAVILALAVCIAAAVCFLTDPRPPVSLASDRALQGVTQDLRRGDPVLQQLNASELDELTGRLQALEVGWENDDYPGMTPLYSMTVELEAAGTVFFHGFADDGSHTAMQVGETYYEIPDEAFSAYLSRICAGESRAAAQEVQVWFDALHGDSMDWGGRREISLDAFPGVTFRWMPETVEAVLEDGEILPLYTAMPIWSVFFADLTGDGLPELCSTVSFGSGVVDNRVLIYDYANGASYELEKRSTWDYVLRLGEDGFLWVDQYAYNSDELLASGRLAYEEQTVQVLFP